jgi:oligopeptide/dipeptide ABC transporter ATP-binding protein
MPEKAVSSGLPPQTEALPAVEARAVSKSYPVRARKLGETPRVLRAVDGVSLSLPKGGIVGVVGESGCGKSTLGRCLLRMESVSGGTLLFQGQDITNLNGRELLPLRRRMQMIFQNPYASFDPKQSIGSALAEVAKVHKIPSGEAKERIAALLYEIGLPEDALERLPRDMSGGQLQRLALARALLLSPDFLVADEPVSALDVSVQAQILNVLTDLREKFALTMLFISHEMAVVRHLCDRVLVLYLGTVVEEAETEELFSHMLHPYTQALFSAIPSLDPERSSQRIVLSGDLPSAMDLPPGCPFAGRCPRCRAGQCDTERPALRDTGGGHLLRCHRAG